MSSSEKSVPPDDYSHADRITVRVRAFVFCSKRNGGRPAGHAGSSGLPVRIGIDFGGKAGRQSCSCAALAVIHGLTRRRRSCNAGNVTMDIINRGFNGRSGDFMISVNRNILAGTALIINFFVAVVGTTILEAPLAALLKLMTHSATSMIAREWICSIVLAGLLGTSAQMRFRSRTARLLWIPAILWLLFGLTGGFNYETGTPLLRFSGVTCAQIRGVPCLQFWTFTVPFIRAVSYSTSAALMKAGFIGQLQTSMMSYF